MTFRNILTAGLLFSLASCSSSQKPEVYNYPSRQLPAEPPYGTTTWVQPPTVVPKNIDTSGFSEHDNAPLLKPANSPLKGTEPRLPSAAGSRRY